MADMIGNYIGANLNTLQCRKSNNKNVSLFSAAWKEELKVTRVKILAHDEMEVNLEMFTEQAREGAVSALKAGNMLCSQHNQTGTSDIKGLSGSFRKLEVDQ